MHRTKSKRRLAVERLEERTLLAGNVAASVAGGDLRVLGDADGNLIEVTAGAVAGEFVIAGLDGTTVNGAPTFTATGVTDDFRFDMRNGDDFVKLVDVAVPDDLQIKTGKGSDTVQVTGATVGDDVRIDTGIDDDDVIIEGAKVGDDLQVVGSKGEQTVLVESSDVQDRTTIDTGRADDSAGLIDSKFGGKTVVKLGGNNDRASIESSKFSRVPSADGGRGTDTITKGYKQLNNLPESSKAQSSKNGSAGDEAGQSKKDSTGDKAAKPKKSSAGDKTAKSKKDAAVEKAWNGSAGSATSTGSGGEGVRGFEGTLPKVAEVKWDYRGAKGPNRWGRLTPAFVRASAGRSQSPIDIVTADAQGEDLLDIVFDYKKQKNLDFIHDGHAVEVRYDKGDSITVDGTVYNLKELQFHTPSEHTIDGSLMAGELHLVHRNPGTGELAVVAVLLDDASGASPHAAWDQLVANLPSKAQPKKKIADPLNAEDLLPAAREYYTYRGSLTAPPAGENVRWLVLEEPVELTPSQIAAFEKAIGGQNNRPVQPLNDRIVKFDQT